MEMIQVVPIPKERPAQMTLVNQTTHTCDWCSKKAVDNGEMRFGGSVGGGWYHVSYTPKTTGLDELKKARQYDFCGFECVSLWVNDRHREKA